MSVPSDISRTVQHLFVYFSYIIGTISLIVNTATLIIILRKSSALTKEVKFLTVFQQLSCLLSNAFLTILFVPFFYLRMGGGYCMGLLCWIVPYQYLLVIQVFLIMCMLSSFGMMLIARQQMLIWENSNFKIRTPVKYVVYSIIICVMHLWTVTSIVVLRSNRRNQNLVLDEYSQISWRERGLNWFLFYGPDNTFLMDLTYYGVFVQIPVFFILIVFPFAHMLHIVLQLIVLLRARKKMHSERNREVHIRNAITIIVQFTILLVFFTIPFVPAIITTLEYEVYRYSQTIVVIAECVFGCSTLLNSIVIVMRNRVYLSCLSFMFHTLPPQRHSIQSISSVVV